MTCSILKKSKILSLKLVPLFTFFIFSFGNSKDHIGEANNSSHKISQIEDVIMLKGLVTDENGNPLPNITVLYKERANSRKTDSNGNFIIAMHLKESLEFSYDGFKTQTIKIRSKKLLNVKLKKL
ncbi:carboxypeptidase-like regulatory domain-containing protein [Flavobacterium sp. FlaQc-57]|uniref:carboxypeptidase-like regulatory domain-containing protein n=1 Tax=Flavobacterium sp. FlaQc-57 TaxID=3374186 RepID=UPI0037573C63